MQGDDDLSRSKFTFPIGFAALLILLFGGMGVLGWISGFGILSKLRSDYIPMAPSSALVFSFLGLGLCWYVARPTSRGAKLFLQFSAVIAVVTGLIVLSQFFFQLQIDLEQMLSSNNESFGKVKLARMSPLTALNFLFDGIALILLMAKGAESRIAASISGILAACAASITMTVSLGYVYGTPILYGAAVIPMALTTALGFLSLDSAIIMIAGPKHLPLRPFMGESTKARLLRAFLPVSSVAVFVNGLLYHLLGKDGVIVNQALLNALSALSATVASAIVITFVAKAISREIDKANKAALVAEDAVKQKDRDFQAFMNNGPFFAFLQDTQGRYVYANPAFAGAHGLTVDQIIGKTNANIGMTRGFVQEVEKDDRNVLASGLKLARVLPMPHLKSGPQHWYIVKFPLLNNDGSTLIGGISIDISERIRAEAERLEAQDQLMQSYKFTALGEMAGNIAHEINNPAAIIEGKAQQLAEILSENPIDKDLAIRFSQAISEMAVRVIKIVNGLRTMSRKADRDPFTARPVAVLVEETLLLCANKLRKQAVAITTKVDPSLEIECRPSEISQVLLNLLSNAIDATEAKPDRWIRVEVEEEPDFISILVTDSGYGIPKEIRHRLAEPFFTTKSEGRGTGLGLSISKGFIAGHGGTLVLSEKSENTCFVVRLPRKQVLITKAS